MKKSNSQRHLEHFRGNEAFAKRIYDQLDLMQRRQRSIVTPFFTPLEGNIAEMIIGKQIDYQKDGGYDGAERCRYAFVAFDDDAIDLHIIGLQASYPSQFATLTHRDVLGALMNLGIERETIGDIVVQDGMIYLYVDQEIEPYITGNLQKIKHCNLHFTPISKRLHHQMAIQERSEIVSSLRMDVIVAALLHVARSKAQMMIRGGLVKVNHVILEQSDALCNNNSAISIRGYGRFQFREVVKMTKKNHYVITVGRYQ